MKIKGTSIIFGSLGINSLAWVGSTKTKFKKQYKGRLSEEQINDAWKVIKSSK